MDQVAAPDPSNVAVRATEKRGYGVPKEQTGRPGRSVVDRGPSADPRAGRNGHDPARGNGAAGRGGQPGHGDDAEKNGGATEREGDGAAMPDRRDPPRWRRRISTTLALIRANPTGRLALKIVIGALGALVVSIGIVLIPLPGPGWLIVIAGLGIWAVEFHWAKRLLGFTRRHVQGWANWVKRQSLAVRFVIGSVGILFVGAVACLSIKYGLGIDVIAQVLRHLATN
ncbi:TIGR02611 family protein [Micromonospora sp. CA-263727]|uniref:TIGR02611 family protein n=1 Tax=Micromonospora sp. CA-263727 TaxID=3239967 RepID=UPI003D8BA9FD